MALLEVGTSTDSSYGQTRYLPKYQCHVCSLSPKKACFGNAQLSSGSPVEVPPPPREPSSLLPSAQGAPDESPDFRLMRKFLHFPYLGTDPPETQVFVPSLSPAAAMMNRPAQGSLGQLYPQETRLLIPTGKTVLKKYLRTNSNTADRILSRGSC